MKQRRLIWKLYPMQLLITISALLAVTWYVSQSVRNFHLRQTAIDLKARARLIEQQVTDYLYTGATEQLLLLSQQAGKKSSTRITVIAVNGRVLADSQEDPSFMDNHADRPEIIAALANKLIPSIRYSNTLQVNMMYVAIPISKDNEIIGVLRTSIPVSAIDTALRNIYKKIGIGVVIISMLVAFVAWLTSRHISRPLETMRRSAERFANGDFSRKLHISGSEELAGLGVTLNKMARQLNERILTVVSQRNELEAIFSSMIEGLFVFDRDENFISINEAGARIIKVEQKNIQGKSILEVVRNTDFLRFVKDTLKSESSLEGEITFSDFKGERFFQAHGVQLKNVDEEIIGGLIVVHDITNLRRLEKVRRDFVANVSHELRTPITSIKGFVETLRDGALEDPENAKKFIEIIFQQANRLNAIIEDLLTLSRIEQQSDRYEIDLRLMPITEIINTAVNTCMTKGESKQITIDWNADKNLQAKINNQLLEQALINLIDNAIKFSASGDKITIIAKVENNSVCIHVKDNGPGISREHLPRLFERFYQVDQARRNKKGGTGLGLSIVKHIVQAHHGDVFVKSDIGKGSTFTICLPLTN